MSSFGSSIWNVLWVLGIPGAVSAGLVMLVAWRRRQWFHFFDAKHNPGFPESAGDFKQHWKHYEGLAKLSITLAAGAIAFLINLLVNQSDAANGFGGRVRHIAPLAIGLFGAAVFLLILFLLWLAYCYEEYCHSLNHSSYRAWKYALSQALGYMGFIAFVAGFLCIGSSVSNTRGQVAVKANATAIVSTPTPGPVSNSLGDEQPSHTGWFFSEQSLAFATWGLVFATLLLFGHGWQVSRRQEKQWEGEEKRRREESMPSAVIEIAVREEASLDMCFACFNLGNNTFYLDKMIVKGSNGRRSESDLTPLIVTPGTWVTIDYNPAEMLGTFGQETPFTEACCTFVLRGAAGTATTAPTWFYVGYGKDRAVWHKGRLADNLPGTIPAQPKVIKTPKE